MEVRLAGPEEAEEVADVFIPSFESLTFLPMLHSHDEHRAFVRSLLERDEVWVAEEQGRVVGMAVLSDEMLDHIYVHPDAQGRGVGSALLRQAKVRRPGGFTLWVFQQNAGARRFYERHGLRAVRFTDGSGNEEKTPDALYEWRPDSSERQENA
jgi:ribosomal protein S18 acetylase RimI-like enzyme